MYITSDEAGKGKARPRLQSHIFMTGLMTLFWLTAAPRAAYAHDDDGPASPEATLLGIVLFVLVTAVLLVLSFCARLPARKRIFRARPRLRVRRRKP